MLKVPFFLCEAGFIEISRVTVEYPMTWSARSSHLLRSFCSRVSARSRESNRHMTHFQMVQGGISSSGASGKTGTCEGTGVFSRDSAKPVPCACTSGVSSWHPVTCHDMPWLARSYKSPRRTCPILSQEAPRLKIINVDGAHRDVLMGFTGGMAMGTWPKWAPTLDHHPPPSRGSSACKTNSLSSVKFPKTATFKTSSTKDNIPQLCKRLLSQSCQSMLGPSDRSDTIPSSNANAASWKTNWQTSSSSSCQWM